MLILTFSFKQVDDFLEVGLVQLEEYFPLMRLKVPEGFRALFNCFQTFELLFNKLFGLDGLVSVVNLLFVESDVYSAD